MSQPIHIFGPSVLNLSMYGKRIRSYLLGVE